MRRLPFAGPAIACAVALSTCLAVAASFYDTPFERRPDARALTALGRTLFFDPALSASGRLSCASCHDPRHAFGPPNGQAVQAGGSTLQTPGLRAVPSLMYRAFTPPFDAHFHDNDGDDSADQGPVGGHDWDGRAASAHEQAAGPLLSPFEMGNDSPSEVVQRLRRSSSALAFREAFGDHALDDEGRAWNGLLWALEVFQQDPATFAPFASRYDRVLRGTAQLSAAERRGLAAFEDPQRGNCAACHPSGVQRGASPLFTDFGHVALALPRNRNIAANADPAFFDLGLAGPLRKDLAGAAEHCGRFKTPSLRNVARRQVFFHNGVITSLEEAVRFYAVRDTDPARYYGRDAAGRPAAPDDLPASCREAVHREPPFGPRADGKPALSDDDIRDIAAFLRTLDDEPAEPGGRLTPPAARHRWAAHDP